MRVAFHGAGTCVFADGFEDVVAVPVETRVLDLGGPVVLILGGLSVLVLAVTLYKLWQFT
ncbi:MAG: hypothetical protein GVY27_03075, partial [Deinococcus-Thermus bacterium]|nr:hypothetical protein [Deinococcota bacterium]